MLFDKKIEPSCSYCAFGAKISGDEVICRKKGIVSPYDSCRKFSYDPMSREPTPPPSLNTDDYSEEDFRI